MSAEKNTFSGAGGFPGSGESSGSSISSGVSGAAWKLTKKALLFSIPFWFVVALYFFDDPFKTLRQYDSYDSNVILDEDFVGWAIYKANKDSLKFNSFILGNSSTMAYRCGEWEKHLDQGDRAVRLFGNAQGLKAILLKLQALERDGANLKNVLIVLDGSSLAMIGQKPGYGYVLPAEVSGKRVLATQSEFIQTFVTPDFLFPYLKYRVTGTVSVSMKHMNPYGRVRDSRNNDAFNPRERMIQEEGEEYWVLNRDRFPDRDGIEVIAPRVIFQPQFEILQEIAGTLHSNHSDVRLVISPDYGQIRLNPADKKELDSLFGSSSVYDFSGVNTLTADYHNYYERSHYRPVLGSAVLDSIYSRAQ